MSSGKKFEKAKAGLLLIASPRFRNLGEGFKRGSYGERKSHDVEGIIGPLKQSINVVFPGIVYDKEGFVVYIWNPEFLKKVKNRPAIRL